MNTSKVSCLLFTVSMILISHSLMAASGEILYEGVCIEAKNLDCVPLVKDDPQLTSTKKYLDLSRFILDFVEKKAREGKEYMFQIAKKYPTECIILCANNTYESTITLFKNAERELIEDPEAAAYEARVAGDGPEYCAEAFKAANIENPPINKLVASLAEWEVKVSQGIVISLQNKAS
ncbi:unnamed protein product [Lupinus luteus]|uniref:Pectinesterase inhibitor domain-containing protein n=1 Tax=Lupinus luteus TaxID=3873 RepID=A0AAV1W199_LUPLU